MYKNENKKDRGVSSFFFILTFFKFKNMTECNVRVRNQNLLVLVVVVPYMVYHWYTTNWSCTYPHYVVSSLVPNSLHTTLLNTPLPPNYDCFGNRYRYEDLPDFFHLFVGDYDVRRYLDSVDELRAVQSTWSTVAAQTQAKEDPRTFYKLVDEQVEPFVSQWTNSTLLKGLPLLARREDVPKWPQLPLIPEVERNQRSESIERLLAHNIQALANFAYWILHTAPGSAVHKRAEEGYWAALGFLFTQRPTFKVRSGVNWMTFLGYFVLVMMIGNGFKIIKYIGEKYRPRQKLD